MVAEDDAGRVGGVFLRQRNCFSGGKGARP